jgi:hypothetical protein
MPFIAGTPAGFNAATGSNALPGAINSPMSGTGGAVGSQAAVKTIYDYNPYSILTQVFQRHDNMRHSYVFRFLLEAMGMSRGVNAPVTGHYEEDRQEQVLKLNAVITPAAGAGLTAVVELHTDNMYAWSGVTANSAAIQASAVRINDVLLLGNGVRAIVTAKNTATNPHRLTIKPLKAAQNLATVGVLTTNVGYMIFTNAWGEGSGLPESRLPRIFKYTNTFQIIKDGYGATGTSATDRLFAEFVNTDDNTIVGVMKRDTMFRFERFVSNALLFGDTIDNHTVFNSNLGVDTPVGGTEGALAFVTGYGHIPTYTLGSYGIADFDVLARILTQEQSSSANVFQMMGFNVFQVIENALYTINAGATQPLFLKQFSMDLGVDVASWQPFEDANFQLYVGFKSVHKSGYNFGFKLMPEFTDVTLGGSSAYNYTNTVVSMPTGTTKNTEGKSVMTWGYEYKQEGSYSRRAVFGQFAGVGSNTFSNIVASGPNDLLNAGILAEVAFHGACPNLGIIQTPA